MKHEQIVELRKRAASLAVELGDPLAAAMDDISEQQGEDASGLTLFSATMAELITNVAGMVAVSLGARDVGAAYDGFVKIVMSQLEEGLPLLRGQKVEAALATVAVLQEQS